MHVMHALLFSHALRLDYLGQAGKQKVPHPNSSKLRRAAFPFAFWATAAVLCDLFHYNPGFFL